MEVNELQPGDHFYMMYETDDVLFYVLANNVEKGRLKITCRGWCVDSAVVWSYSNMRPFSFVGRGKKRWWWRVLPWRNIVAVYSPPQNLLNSV
ncbi:hypothetical protein [Trichloromonas sp.]|uniref:hypothetical protein n=1 Tax=Trichloromonas sp. TaxID=3069249 RepID=UPI003D8155CA